MSVEGQRFYPGESATPWQIAALADEYRQAADALLKTGRRGVPLSRAPYRVSRADVVKHGMGPDPRDPAERHLGKGPRDIYIPDLRLGSGIIPGEPVEGIKIRTRDFR